MIKRKIDQRKTFFDPSNIFNVHTPKHFYFLKSINQSIKIESDTTTKKVNCRGSTCEIWQQMCTSGVCRINTLSLLGSQVSWRLSQLSQGEWQGAP